MPFIVALLLCFFGFSALAAAPSEAPLDTQVQDLKKEILALNRDLFILEEELLYPANTQTAVFLSMDVGEFFALDSVQLKVDGEDVVSYLYTEREIEALVRGGVQKLWLGNLKSGEHELVAFFTGKDPSSFEMLGSVNLAPWSIVIVDTWMWTPFVMLICLAGLRS
ncbi:MAG: hypothetical protein AAFN78_15155, partial [Pseudomonadota bacterium]